MVWSKFRSRKSLQSGLMGLCGCNLKEKLQCSNGIHVGKNWHQIRISRSGERQKICRIVAMKIRGNILCSGKLDGLCCWWNAYHQNLDMIDEMKHLPWAWKPFTIVFILSEASWGLLFKSRYCSSVSLLQQNSPYFCVFKYARTVKQKVWNEAENRERDWKETIKIRTVRFAHVIYVRITRFSQPRAIPIS